MTHTEVTIPPAAGTFPPMLGYQERNDRLLSPFSHIRNLATLLPHCSAVGLLGYFISKFENLLAMGW